MTVKVYKWLDRLTDLLLPPRCVLCAAPGQRPCLDLCADCQAELPAALQPSCIHCAAPLLLVDASDGICAVCRIAPPDYDRCLTAYEYRYPVDQLICGLKYRGRLAPSRVLGTLLGESIAARHRPPDVDLLLPVPLHPNRLVQRGFNQSLEIARWTARYLGLALATRCLRRRRDTRPQVGLSVTRRKANLRGAFGVAHGLSGRRVAVIDDVLTTGSTVGEIARTLRRAGVAAVEVWCVARAPNSPPSGAGFPQTTSRRGRIPIRKPGR
jgi:ComF family protein